MVAAMSFRNLLRQKRRNMLLGIAIAFGAMVLILANAFSHGISKVMFERIVRYAVGHVSVSYMRSGDMMNMVFHDDERILEAIKKAAPEAARTEEGAGFWGRAIGKGMADNVMLVGIDMRAKITEKEQKEYESNFKMIHGSFNALRDNSRGIPVLLSEQKAKYLKVKTGDIVRVRFTGIYNQTTSAQLLVVGIFKPANVFMAIPVFLELQDLRRLGGYGPHDIAAMQVGDWPEVKAIYREGIATGLAPNNFMISMSPLAGHPIFIPFKSVCAITGLPFVIIWEVPGVNGIPMTLISSPMA